MRLARIGLSGLAIALLPIGPALAGSMRDIDFGVNTWVTQKTGPDGTSVPVLRQASGPLSTSIDAGTPYTVWTVPGPTPGEDALAIRLDAEQRPPTVSQKSKFEINVVRQDDDALDQRFGHRFVLRNGGADALRFTFMMDQQAYDDPKRWVLHAQVWQCCSTQTMPALAFQAIPGAATVPGTVDFALIARTDDDRVPGAHSDAGHHLSFTDGTTLIALHRGHPYKMVLHLLPDPGTRVAGRLQSRTGTVALTVDGREVLRYRGPWGYTPDAASGVQSTYAVKLGIYRAAQPVRQQVYFSDIHWETDAVAGPAAAAQ